MATSYQELLEDVPVTAFARNNDLMAAMPKVIARAENYVINRLDHDAFRDPAVPIVLDTSGIFDLPAGTMEVRGCRIQLTDDRWSPLRQRNEEMLTALFTGHAIGVPTFYARLAGDQIRVFPAPYRTYDLLLTANIKPAPLSPTNQTNLLTDEWDELLTLATLRAAAVYMSDTRLIGLYSGEVGEALTMANMAIARTRRDEAVQRPAETANVRGA